MTPWTDAHMHAYPPSLADDAAGWAQRQSEPHWQALHAPTKGKTLHTWPDAQERRARMDEAGIDRAVLLGWYWENHDTALQHNDWMAALQAQDPARYLPFATVHPGAGDAAIAELERRLDDGFAGIGELFPPAQGYAFADPGFHRVLAWAEVRRLPVTLHVTEAAGHPYAGRVEAPLGVYLDLAARFPRLPLILAHWGGGLPFYALNRRVAKRLRNVWFDTAASPLLYDGRIWKLVTDLIGPERILFGSDYPLRLYPRQDEQAGIQRLRAEAEHSGLDEAALDRIGRDNFAELLSLRQQG